MYTPDSLAMRAAIREHPAVQDALARFASLYHFDTNGLVSFEAYGTVHEIIVKVMLPELPLQDVHKTVVDDWEEDRAGAECMSAEQIYASIFECADLWCPGLAVEE